MQRMRVDTRLFACLKPSPQVHKIVGLGPSLLGTLRTASEHDLVIRPICPPAVRPERIFRARGSAPEGSSSSRRSAIASTRSSSAPLSWDRWVPRLQVAHQQRTWKRYVHPCMRSCVHTCINAYIHTYKHCVQRDAMRCNAMRGGAFRCNAMQVYALTRAQQTCIHTDS